MALLSCKINAVSIFYMGHRFKYFSHRKLFQIIIVSHIWLREYISLRLLIQKEIERKKYIESINNIHLAL